MLLKSTSQQKKSEISRQNLFFHLGISQFPLPSLYKTPKCNQTSIQYRNPTGDGGWNNYPRHTHTHWPQPYTNRYSHASKTYKNQSTCISTVHLVRLVHMGFVCLFTGTCSVLVHVPLINNGCTVAKEQGLQTANKTPPLPKAQLRTVQGNSFHLSLHLTMHAPTVHIMYMHMFQCARTVYKYDNIALHFTVYSKSLCIRWDLL